MKRCLLLIVLYLALPMVMLPTLWNNPLSAGEDDTVYYYPLRKIVAAELAQGRLPLYNAREATGMPLMADPQTAVLHPTTWLFVAMDAKLAYAASLYLAFSLAGGGAYLYLRRLGLITPAAVLGSIVFMFCGFMVGHRVHQSVILAASMLPWGLWVVEGLRRTTATENTEHPERKFHSSSSSEDSVPSAAVVTRSTIRNSSDRLLAALLLVPIVYWTITAGHWPTLIHMCLIWGVYFLFRARPIVSSGLMVAGAMVAAALLALPQLKVTADLLASATRQKIGLAMAGENSFLPTSGVLAMFPFFQGCRTTNFFPQTWWGSWHLCEMLGYAGLLTLVLAGAVIWRGFRKERRAADAPAPCDVTTWNGPIRTWTFMIVGAAIFMMGYYLPTYRLINMLPGLGVVRCPARMVLAVDMGLATLAAIGVHLLLTAPTTQPRMQRLRQTLRKLALYVLPATMIATLLIWAGIAGLWWTLGFRDSFYWLPFEGGARQVFAALGVHITDSGATSFSPNPAVWVPLVLMILTAITVMILLKRTGESYACAETQPDVQEGTPSRLRFRNHGRALPVTVITTLILVDLFFITRFVDVPASGATSPDPAQSPAGQWLAQHDPNLDSYRIYTLSPKYYERCDELLHPKTCTVMGFNAIGNYGPFQSPYHVQMLGFRIWGLDRDWADHLRGNHLLSLYGVKYIIAADPKYREVLDSVTVPTQAKAADDENLLTQSWSTRQDRVSSAIGAAASITGTKQIDDTISLKTPLLWWSCEAWQPLKLSGEGVYKISFDARGPQGGAACYLSAEITKAKCEPANAWFEAEEIGQDWRHFECVTNVSDIGNGQGWAGPPAANGQPTLYVHSRGERPIEVRNIRLQKSHFRGPINFGGKLKAGDHVYTLLKELPARDPSQPPVAIYENRLAQPIPAGDRLTPATSENVDAIKYLAEDTTVAPSKLPDISLPPVKSPATLIKMVTLPVGGLWLLGVVVIWRRRGDASMT